MVPISELWLPMALSAVFVFIASSIANTVLPHHKGDFGRLPNEADVAEAMRKAGVTPGEYVMPYCTSMSDMKDPAFVEKMTKGPVAMMTVMKNGPPAMGGQLVQWFVYCLVVSLFAAYIAGRALGPGAHYLAVFRFAGATAFAAYTLALWQNSIWYKRAWSTTLKHTADGLVYALLTAGTFGWLWPR
jgi:hypothetical protein